MIQRGSRFRRDVTPVVEAQLTRCAGPARYDEIKRWRSISAVWRRASLGGGLPISAGCSGSGRPRRNAAAAQGPGPRIRSAPTGPTPPGVHKKRGRDAPLRFPASVRVPGHHRVFLPKMGWTSFSKAAAFPACSRTRPSRARGVTGLCACKRRKAGPIRCRKTRRRSAALYVRMADIRRDFTPKLSTTVSPHHFGNGPDASSACWRISWRRRAGS